MQYPQVLDECITHLQDGSWTLESCLAQYPMYADQLNDDLAIVHLTQQLSRPRMSASSVDAMEAKLLKKFNPTSAPVKPVKKTIRPQWYAQPFVRWAAGFVFMLLFLVGSGASTIAVSASSLPGDGLYPVKTTWEQVVVFGAVVTNQEDAVRLSLAETRANEIVQLYEAGRANDITGSVIDTFYVTAETAILQSTPATASAYIAMTEEVTPIFEQTILQNVNETRRLRILQVLNPVVSETGVLVISASSEQYLPEVEETPTEIPSATPTLTLTPTITPTLTFTPTATPTELPTETRTPTPSRTPTGLPTIVITTTPLPTMTATPTLTPLLLETRAVAITRTVEGDVGEQVSGEGVDDFFARQNELFVRETERAVELTQTVLAPTERAIRLTQTALAPNN